MQLLKITALSIILSGTLFHSAQAATDYNSSRSNKSEDSGLTAPEVTDDLLKKAQMEASLVSKSMIEVDQRDGYEGEYEITVDVRVRIERIPRPGKGKIIIKDVRKR